MLFKIITMSDNLTYQLFNWVSLNYKNAMGNMFMNILTIAPSIRYFKNENYIHKLNVDLDYLIKN